MLAFSNALIAFVLVSMFPALADIPELRPSRYDTSLVVSIVTSVPFLVTSRVSMFGSAESAPVTTMVWTAPFQAVRSSAVMWRTLSAMCPARSLFALVASSCALSAAALAAAASATPCCAMSSTAPTVADSASPLRALIALLI